MQRSSEPSPNHQLSCSGLTRDELQELCRHLGDSNTEKSLRLSNLHWKANDTAVDAPSETSDMLSRMITSNYGLKKIQLDDKPEQNDAAHIIKALNKNFDILEFNMPCSEREHKFISLILERNKQFRIAQKLLINQLLSEIKSETALLDAVITPLQAINDSDATADEVSYELFHAHMRSQSGFAELSVKIKNTIDTIKKLKIAGSQQGVNALQAAAALNLVEYTKGLIQSGINLDTANYRHETALVIAAHQGNLDIVKLLCESGADKNLRDEDGRTPYEYALENRRHEIADYLDPAASFSEKQKYLTKRNLIVGFGVSIFDDIHRSKNIKTFNFGGGKREGASILAEYLEKFTTRHHNNPKLLAITKHFHAAIENVDLTPDELARKLKTERIIHTMTGFLSHFCGVSIMKQPDNSFVLYLSDRGFFLDRAPHNTFNDKQPSLQSITIPAETIPDILNIIVNARNESSKSPEEMLFTDIPNLSGSEWRYHAASLQSALKSGTCFFSNIKALLLNEINLTFGVSAGKKLYKEFTLFLRTELLRDYEQYAESEDPYVFLAKAKVLEKKFSFMSRFT